MPSDKADLSARLIATQRGDSVLGLFFQSVLELVQQRAGEGALATVRSTGLSFDYSALRMYPVQDFLKLLFAAADALEGVFGSPEAVFRVLGNIGMTRYDSGPGRFVVGVLSRGEPHRLFGAVQLGYSGAVTYGRREYRATGLKSGVVVCEGDMLPPPFHEGLLTGAVELLSFKGHVKARPLAIDRVEYDVSWD